MLVKPDYFVLPEWNGAKWNKTVVMISGAFDPLHIGHLQYIVAASRINAPNNLVVAVVNGDGFLNRKRKHSFMPEYDRAMIVDNIKGVYCTMIWDDGTQLVDGALNLIKPNIFAKGVSKAGDDSIPESEQRMCDLHDIEVRHGLGGPNKLNSSSELLENFRKLQTSD